MSSKKSKNRQFGSIRKLPSGKYQASYKRQVKGHKKTFYAPGAFATKTEANNWLAQEHHLAVTGKWTEPSIPNPINTTTPTFSEFAHRHIKLQTNSSGAGLKPSTVAKYESYLAKNLAQFSNQPIDSISKSQVDTWWIQAIATKRFTTASKAYKLMHAVYVRAVADGWIPNGVNPCQVKGAQNASTGVSIYTPTLDEVSHISENIDPIYKTMVLVTAYAALRFGEVTALQRKHFILETIEGKDRYRIDIRQAVTYVDGKFILGTPKNPKGINSVLISSGLTHLINEHLDSLKDQSENALVFSKDGQSYIRNDLFAKALKKAVRKAGLSGKAITPHSLRRAGGTAYSNQGANLNEVKDFLRDSSTEAVLRYIKPTGRTEALAEGMKYQK